MTKPRKIKLPDYCCAATCKTRGGDRRCDHDYPPESQQEHDDFEGPSWVEWTCSKCGMRTSVEVYQ